MYSLFFHSKLINCKKWIANIIHCIQTPASKSEENINNYYNSDWAGLQIIWERSWDFAWKTKTRRDSAEESEESWPDGPKRRWLLIDYWFSLGVVTLDLCLFPHLSSPDGWSSTAEGAMSIQRWRTRWWLGWLQQMFRVPRQSQPLPRRKRRCDGGMRWWIWQQVRLLPSLVTSEKLKQIFGKPRKQSRSGEYLTQTPLLRCRVTEKETELCKEAALARRVEMNKEKSGKETQAGTWNKDKQTKKTKLEILFGDALIKCTCPNCFIKSF